VICPENELKALHKTAVNPIREYC